MRKEFSTLRELFRLAEHRRFLAKHRSNKQAEFMGFAPDGTMHGWWVGTDEVLAFDADDRQWTQLVTYV